MRETPLPLTNIVVVGAGLAGWSVVRELRKRDANSRITMISADSADFYSKPSLSNALVQQRQPSEFVTTSAREMEEKLNVELFSHTRVSSINTACKSLMLRGKTGEAFEIPYQKLVLATGADPIRLPFKGDSDAVIAVNNLADYRVLHAQLSAKNCRVLIIGAGLIGCEFADDLASSGHTVHVVDLAERPLESVLPAPAAYQLQRGLAELGVNWTFESSVERVDRLADGTLGVTLAEGNHYNVDIVLSAVGLRPNTDIAQKAGLRCDRGVLVDALLKTSADDVYALGDVAQYATAENQILPYVMPIMVASKALAATLTGQPTSASFPVMPISIKTTSLPVVAHPPGPKQRGFWQGLGDADKAWQFVDAQGRVYGFALLGAEVTRRGQLSKALSLAR